jgi:hypothetical protein
MFVQTSDVMDKETRYLIGIDLGTTTCSVFYIDTISKPYTPKRFSILQWDREGKVVKSEKLPSFCFFPNKKAIGSKEYVLEEVYKDSKLSNWVLGKLAYRKQISDPARVISSAKSWICCDSVNRSDKILPWSSELVPSDEKLSPIDVMGLYLEHIRLFWNKTIGVDCDKYYFERQNIVITVPASFDPVAQDLIVKASVKAGYNSDTLTLIEEPQAAFYSWLYDDCGIEKWKLKDVLLEKIPAIVDSSQSVLVCDIGGGTCDFSLFSIGLTNGSEEGFYIKRTSVGDHILLGGDNVDLAVASLFEDKFDDLYKNKLTAKQWNSLVASIRDIKEEIFSFSGIDKDIFISIDSHTKSLFTGCISIGVSKKKIVDYVLSKFFPLCELGSNVAQKKSAICHWGLQYAQDLAFTRHLSKFLSGKRVDAVLFVGGSLIPKVFQEKIMENLSCWYKKNIVKLSQYSLDLSVSRGASVFALAKDGKFFRVSAGYPNSLYLMVKSQNSSTSDKLLCLLPKGYEGGGSIKIALDNLCLLLGKRVAFRVFYSSHRDFDRAGEIFDFVAKDFKCLPSLEVVVGKQSRQKKIVLVDLEVLLTHSGVLKLFCVQKENKQKHQLQFNLQKEDILSVSGSEIKAKKTEAEIIDISKQIDSAVDVYYGKRNKETCSISTSPKELLFQLETITKYNKQDWDIKTLRTIADSLFVGINRRLRSYQHESGWYSLLGYCLRPGCGDSLDVDRISVLWSIYTNGLSKQASIKVKESWFVMWRRVSAGLNGEQQNFIYKKLFPRLRHNEASVEMILLLGSLERVGLQQRVVMGNFIVDQLLKGSQEYAVQKIWCLTRLATRVPLYAGSVAVIMPCIVELWIEKIFTMSKSRQGKYQEHINRFLLCASRLIADRGYDICPHLRAEVIEYLKSANATNISLQAIKEYVPPDDKYQMSLLGEQLPVGLSFRNLG